MITIAKIHARKKRLLGLRTHLKHRYFFSGITKKRGDRTFRTKEQALEYAKEKGLKGAKIVPAKKGKRFKIA